MHTTQESYNIVNRGIHDNPQLSKRLYQFTILILIATPLWFISTHNWVIDNQTLWGIGIMLVASYPALRWAKKCLQWFPTFEVFMLTAIPQYALPLLAHQRQLRFYPDSLINKSCALLFFYIILAILGFSIMRKVSPPSEVLTRPLIPEKLQRFTQLGLFASNLILYIYLFEGIIPSEYRKILWATIHGVGTLSIFMISRMWGSGGLSQLQKVLFILNLFSNIALYFTTIYLGTGFSMAIIAIIAYSTTRRQLPWLSIIALFSVISILQLGKGDMRVQYWNSDSVSLIRKKHDITTLPLFFGEWIGYSLGKSRESKYSNSETHSTLERASILHIFCLAVDKVPRETHYLNGESYLSIPILLVPRVLWPEKPMVMSSNDQLMITLGLVNPDNIDVNIAIGMPAEAYMNFGILGLGILALVFGLGFKYLSLLSKNTSQFSALGILAILATASSLQAEQNAAVWLSSLFQSAIVCIGIPLIYTVISNEGKINQQTK